MYDEQHIYLTVHWFTGSIDTEQGQFGIRFNHDEMWDSTSRDAVAAEIATWWASANAFISSNSRLFMLKFALIGTDGLYPPDEESIIHEYDPTIAGESSGASAFPLQTAHVMSLTTSAVRGRAHRGRVYLPPLEDDLTSGGVWATAQVAARATSFATMLSNVNGDVIGQAGVYSKIGSGLHRLVTGVAAGNRPDVQRSRAASIPEVYSTAAVTDG